MGHRLPTILGKAIEDVVETLNGLSDEDEITDLVKCIERMDGLKLDLEKSALLRPIVDDGEADVALWNKEIAKYFRGMLGRASCRFEPFSFDTTFRQGFYECPMAFRRSIQVSPSPRMFQRQQVLGHLRRLLQAEGKPRRR